jgi:hypothetical protein
MFKLIDDEHDCFDFVNDEDLPTYVLSGDIEGIGYNRIESMVNYLEEAIAENKLAGTICITSNFKSATSYDYITTNKSELDLANDIQKVIEKSIRQFSTLH